VLRVLEYYNGEKMRKIALIYIDAGGGHRAAANALCEVI